MKIIVDDVIERIYESLVNGDDIRKIHIPHSTVFYVREHLKDVFGETFPLDYVERCLYLEGMLEAKDVFEPDRTRVWELDECGDNELQDRKAPAGNY